MNIKPPLTFSLEKGEGGTEVRVPVFTASQNPPDGLPAPWT